MSHAERPILNELTLEGLARYVTTISDIMFGGIEFGVPDDGSGGTFVTHGGNMEGQWVTGSFTANDTATTITHNMDLSTTGTINCRWLIFRIEHSGVGATGGDDQISISFETGDTVAADTIQLRAHGGANRTVSGDEPITVDFFFIPAVT